MGIIVERFSGDNFNFVVHRFVGCRKQISLMIWKHGLSFLEGPFVRLARLVGRYSSNLSKYRACNLNFH